MRRGTETREGRDWASKSDTESRKLSIFDGRITKKPLVFSPSFSFVLSTYLPFLATDEERVSVIG